MPSFRSVQNRDAQTGTGYRSTSSIDDRGNRGGVTPKKKVGQTQYGSTGFNNFLKTLTQNGQGVKSSAWLDENTKFTNTGNPLLARDEQIVNNPSVQGVNEVSGGYLKGAKTQEVVSPSAGWLGQGSKYSHDSEVSLGIPANAPKSGDFINPANVPSVVEGLDSSNGYYMNNINANMAYGSTADYFTSKDPILPSEQKQALIKDAAAGLNGQNVLLNEQGVKAYFETTAPDDQVANDWANASFFNPKYNGRVNPDTGEMEKLPTTMSLQIAQEVDRKDETTGTSLWDAYLDNLTEDERQVLQSQGINSATELYNKLYDNGNMNEYWKIWNPETNPLLPQSSSYGYGNWGSGGGGGGGGGGYSDYSSGDWLDNVHWSFI
jgi:hypothetical protein